MAECETEDKVYIAIVLRNLPLKIKPDEVLELWGSMANNWSELIMIRRWLWAIVTMNTLESAEQAWRKLNRREFKDLKFDAESYSDNKLKILKVHMHPKANYRE